MLPTIIVFQWTVSISWPSTWQNSPSANNVRPHLEMVSLLRNDCSMRKLQDRCNQREKLLLTYQTKLLEAHLVCEKQRAIVSEKRSRRQWSKVLKYCRPIWILLESLVDQSTHMLEALEKHGRWKELLTIKDGSPSGKISPGDGWIILSPGCLRIQP